MSDRSSSISKSPPSWAEPPPPVFGDAQVVALKVVGGLLSVVALGIALFVIDWRREAAEAEELKTLAASSSASGGGAAAVSPSLWVNAGPIGSTVLVDGDSVGTTPLWLSAVGLGPRVVQVIGPDGVVVDTTVSLEAGFMTEIDLTDRPASDGPARGPVEVAAALPAAPQPQPPSAPAAPTPTVRQIQTGTLRVTSSPAGATVVLDGRRIGTTPLAVSNLAVGRHTLHLSKGGFENVARNVDIRAGAEFEADLDLRPRAAAVSPPAAAVAPRAGTIEVLVRPWGTVYVDGEVRQRETDVVYRTQLPPGPHRIRATHPTLGAVEREIVVDPGSTARIEFDLEGGALDGAGPRQ